MGCCVAWRPSFTEIPSLIVAVSLHFMPRLPAFHVHVSTNIKAPDCSGKNKLRDQITHHHATRHHTRRHTQRQTVSSRLEICWDSPEGPPPAPAKPVPVSKACDLRLNRLSVELDCLDDGEAEGAASSGAGCSTTSPNWGLL